MCVFFWVFNLFPFTSIYTYAIIHTYAYIEICMYVYVCKRLCMCMYVHVCNMYVCIFAAGIMETSMRSPASMHDSREKRQGC